MLRGAQAPSNPSGLADDDARAPAGNLKTDLGRRNFTYDDDAVGSSRWSGGATTQGSRPGLNAGEATPFYKEVL